MVRLEGSIYALWPVSLMEWLVFYWFFLFVSVGLVIRDNLEGELDKGFSLDWGCECSFVINTNYFDDNTFLMFLSLMYYFLVSVYFRFIRRGIFFVACGIFVTRISELCGGLYVLCFAYSI